MKVTGKAVDATVIEVLSAVFGTEWGTVMARCQTLGWECVALPELHRATSLQQDEATLQHAIDSLPGPVPCPVTRSATVPPLRTVSETFEFGAAGSSFGDDVSSAHHQRSLSDLQPCGPWVAPVPAASAPIKFPLHVDSNQHPMTSPLVEPAHTG